MGNELAMWREWNDGDGLPWGWAGDPPHAGVRRLVQDLNGLYRRDPALHQVDYDPSGFQWIDCNDSDNSVVSLLRRGRDAGDEVLAIFNFTPVVRHRYRLGVPAPGRYREILNTDAEIYGGGNVGNAGLLEAEPEPAHGHAQSLSLTLPPLAGLIFRRDPAGSAD
jgi:1,4-alpha-glucan branching enzyme